MGLTNRNKKLKADFDKTLSKEKLQELIKDYPVKLHEERDELLVKVDRLSEEKRELEIELDDLRMKGLKYGKSDDSSLQDQIGLQKTEIDLMKQEYEAEVDQLKRDKSKLHKENAELTNRNKKLKADFDKTLS